MRCKLMEYGYYNRASVKDGLYLPLCELGYGLVDFRMEYGKELLRVITKLKGNHQDQIMDLQNQ